MAEEQYQVWRNTERTAYGQLAKLQDRCNRRLVLAIVAPLKKDAQVYFETNLEWLRQFILERTKALQALQGLLAGADPLLRISATELENQRRLRSGNTDKLTDLGPEGGAALKELETTVALQNEGLARIQRRIEQLRRLQKIGDSALAKYAADIGALEQQAGFVAECAGLVQNKYDALMAEYAVGCSGNPARDFREDARSAARNSPARSDRTTRLTWPGLEDKWTAYQTAYAGLLKGDSNLEKDLRTAPRQQVLERIGRQEQRVEVFNGAGLELYRAMRAGLDVYWSGMRPGKRVYPTVFRTAINDGLAEVKQQRNTLDHSLKAAARNPAMTAALSSQKDLLLMLEINLLKEDEGLSKATSSGAEADAAMHEVGNALQALAAGMDDDGRVFSGIGAQWAGYYGPLRTLVEARQETVRSPLAGIWRDPGGRKFSLVPLKSFQLRIEVSGSLLRGWLTVDCIPPWKSKTPAHLEAAFLAEAGSKGPYPFAVDNLAGVIHLTPQGPTLVAVVYINGEEQFAAVLDRVGP